MAAGQSDRRAIKGGGTGMAGRNSAAGALDLLGIEGDSLRISMRCSSGTHVRSLAHDLGNLLGPGGHVTASA